MPKITFNEFRPGKWVKLVDGQVVGPASAEEVAAWKREKAAPARIWEDVVATAPRPELGEAKKAQTSTARSQSDESTIWDDLVKRAKPSVRAEGPPGPRPRKEDTDHAEQAEIWQDVVKRVLKPAPGPERLPAREAPASTEPAPAAKPGPAAKATPSPLATRPQREGTTTKRAFAAEAVSPRLADKPPTPAATTRPAKETPTTKKAPGARPAPKPATPARRAAKAEKEPARAPAPPEKAQPAEPLSASKAPVAKPASQRPAAKTATKTRGAARAVSAKKATASTRRHRAPIKDTLPARLLDEIEEESAPEVPVEEAAPQARPEVSPISGRASAGLKPRGSPAMASHRTPRKARATAPPERPNQLYLWIAAGQTDDLIATVRTGLARYQERFSHAAEVVLCHSTDLPTLEGAKLPVDLREGKSLAPRNFWIGLK